MNLTSFSIIWFLPFTLVLSVSIPDGWPTRTVHFFIAFLTPRPGTGPHT